MSKGFYHPNNGYWETTTEPSSEILESYPKGYQEVPVRPSDGYNYDLVDGAWVKGEKIMPIPRRTGEFRDFMKFFTREEQLKIVSATMADPGVKLWYDSAMGGAVFSLDHPETSEGLTALVNAELLTQARMDEIMNNGNFDSV